MTTGDAHGKRALARVREQGGIELASRLEHLDAVRFENGSKPRGDKPLRAPPIAIDAPEKTFDFDVVVAGGGLSLLIAAEMARLGLRVLVVERLSAGATHREWNASADELTPLVSAEIVSAELLRELVIATYKEGVCVFHGGSPRRVRGVLDHAVDAGALLARVRSVAEARGVTFLENASVDRVGASAHAVRVGWTTREGSRGEAVARVMLDARGAASPYSRADLVCPTVGGVMRGLHEGRGPREVDMTVGDILVTTEGIDVNTGMQHVWEGFPGKPGEVTVYLFYYGRAEHVPNGTLAQLYARFFDTLATYKEGDARMIRPTFGYIPGWSRLVRAPKTPSPRIVLVGDAAARHSPLTFCGFGSMLRSFQPIARAVAEAVTHGHAPNLQSVPDENVHAWTGALARVMASGSLRGDALNRLLDAAFAVLESLGNEAFADLLKDRMQRAEFIAFLRKTAARHPSVYRDVLGALGPGAAVRWGARLAWNSRARESSRGPKNKP